ncbi:nitroreductase family protein [Candidatus Woesearchaeota archaeon]|nr:nitroreductase family protein [Candidatus Woesearchaeota archaeon]
MKKINQRNIGHDVLPLFAERWSPRAMSGEEISDKQLMQLFEAARWAPSSYNGQPWRFLYAKKETPHWDTFFNLLIDFNKQWTKNAAVLIVVLSKKTFEHNNKPCKTHAFDTGAAWQNLALQGSTMSLVVHGMEGFDYDKAKKDLHIPDDYQVEAMIAIGKPGKKEDLPKEMQEREFPSDRKKIEEFVKEGKWE